MKYELTFTGTVPKPRYFPRYRRMHSTLESARATAAQVREKLEHVPAPGGLNGMSPGSPADGHVPIIYDSHGRMC